MQKRSKNKKTGRIPKLAKTRKVLCFLAEITGGYFEIWYDASDFRSALMRGGVEYVKIVKGELREKKLRHTLYQLKRAKCINIQRTGNSMKIKLTEKGWAVSLADRMRVAKPLSDGNICLVSFDIPETERELRARFRRFLKSCGFKIKQKSLWVSEKNVSQLMARAVKSMCVEDWINVYTCRQIEN